jgi:hypothetical protein
VARDDLPTGTVTFLFTDVEGSTRLVREHGSAYAKLLAEHRRWMRGVFARHATRDTQAMPSSSRFREQPMRLRRRPGAKRPSKDDPRPHGIHTGERMVTAEATPIDIHRAARSPRLPTGDRSFSPRRPAGSWPATCPFAI